jgi:hypothetical protein
VVEFEWLDDVVDGIMFADEGSALREAVRSRAPIISRVSMPASAGQLSGSRSRYIKNLEKEKKPNTMASGRTSQRLLLDTVSAIRAQ